MILNLPIVRGEIHFSKVEAIEKLLLVDGDVLNVLSYIYI